MPVRFRLTINDIAELAGVSISTVSKIINGKSSGIKNETREHVLQIVKEYHYRPYNFIKQNPDTKTFLLGLLLTGNKKYNSFQYGFLTEAEKRGYQVQLCFSSSFKSREKDIAALCNNRADAIVCQPVSDGNDSELAVLKKTHIPFVLLDYEEPQAGLSYNYQDAGYTAATKLVSSGHTRICCVFDKSEKNEWEIAAGVERCLFDNHCVYTEYKDLYEALYIHGCSAFVCCGRETALNVYEYAVKHKFRIPHDISLIYIDDKDCIGDFPPVSSIALDLSDFGSYVCNAVINKIEKLSSIITPYVENYTYNDRNSIDYPVHFSSKRIIVVGGIHTDVLLYVKEYPQIGESIPAHSMSVLPGGKGINQAVGAAKLGAKVSLIGKVGRDFDSNMLLNVLHENGVDTSAVHIDTENPTGKAYIHVQEDGESGIVLYSGANLSVTADTIEQSEQLFSDAAFCLLQTEIPMCAVKKAVEIARKNNVKIMLKPSNIEKIDESLLPLIDYFIPNKKELHQLCSHGQTVEEKAAWFLKKGVKTVIVTLGSEGCYVAGCDFELHLAAAPFVPVDTTGAADAFISALAVYLLKEIPLSQALKYASCAAGFSTTRTGVVPSLIDTATLEYYIHKMNLKEC